MKTMSAVTKGFWLACLCLVPGLGTAGTLSAVNMHLGPIELLPEMRYDEVYNDNVYRAESDEKDDYRQRFGFGADARLPMGRHQFLAGYHGVYHHLNTFDEFNRLENLVTTQFRFNLRSGTAMRLQYEMADRSLEPNFPGDRRNDFRQHVATTAFTYPATEKISLDAQYRYEDLGFDDPEDRQDDYTKNVVTGRLQYAVSTQTSFIGEYTLFVVDNAISPTDNKKHDVLTGLELEITDKVTGMFKVGYSAVRFADGTAPSDFSARADLVFELRPTTRILFQLLRDIEETTLTGETAVNGNYFVISAVGAEIRQNLGAKARLSLAGNYSGSNFPKGSSDIERRDTFYLGRAEAAYFAQPWLRLGVGWQYARNDSNVFVNDFKQHQVFAYLDFKAAGA